ncbi:uncharacterized protein AMSG_03861 [Thecamonas trahens ATCC 50062]|uniref:Uncharacterized protein n=1 Tax=Thecamonas trahens ATCC 50062 TaxID=461836 RepID=A0A0L0D7Z4_THETB|nr:hypothetical protein AMSG_03861 [Thecamonas trahens ATCC 50062]KNC47428.1 hypothetical protein AMSG_03861 [Thecamonas trahens ATCC 50062]|eukprot:XP_013759764.1 hypothetical protein AMSG_03861 [Thecamonas trahens ATCC 50062]
MLAEVVDEYVSSAEERSRLASKHGEDVLRSAEESIDALPPASQPPANDGPESAPGYAHARKVQVLEELLAKADDEVFQLRDEAAALKTEAQTLRAELAAARSAGSEASARVEADDAALADVGAKLAASEAERESLEADLATLQATLEQTRASSVGQASALQDHVASLEDQLAVALAERAELAAEIKRQTEQLRERDTLAAKLDAASAAVAQATADRDATRARYETALTDAAAEASSTAATLAALENEISQLTTLNEELTRDNSQLTVFVLEGEQAKTKLDHALSQMDNLEADLELVTSKLEETRQAGRAREDTLQEMVDSQRVEIAELRAIIAATRADNSDSDRPASPTTSQLRDELRQTKEQAAVLAAERDALVSAKVAPESSSALLATLESALTEKAELAVRVRALEDEVSELTARNNALETMSLRDQEALVRETVRAEDALARASSATPSPVSAPACSIPDHASLVTSLTDTQRTLKELELRYVELVTEHNALVSADAVVIAEYDALKADHDALVARNQSLLRERPLFTRVAGVDGGPAIHATAHESEDKGSVFEPLPAVPTDSAATAPAASFSPDTGSASARSTRLEETHATIESLLDEIQTLTAERDAAIAERDAAVAERDAASRDSSKLAAIAAELAERDAAYAVSRDEVDDLRRRLRAAQDRAAAAEDLLARPEHRMLAPRNDAPITMVVTDPPRKSSKSPEADAHATEVAKLRARLREQSEDHIAETLQYSEQISQLRNELAELHRELAAARAGPTLEEYEVLAEDLKALQADHVSLEAEHAQLVETNAQLASVAANTAAAEAAEAAAEQQMAAVADAVTTAGTTVDALSTRIAELEEKVRAETSRAADLQTELITARASERGLRDQVAALQTDAASAAHDASSHSAETAQTIASLQEQVQWLTDQNTELEASLTAYQDQVEAYAQQIQDEFARETESTAALKNENSRLKTELIATEARVAQLGDAMSALETQLRSTTLPPGSEASALQEKLVEAYRELALEQGSNSGSRAAKDLLAEQVASLQADLAAERAARQAAEQAAAHEESQAQQAAKRLDTVTAKIDNIHAEREKASRRVVELEVKVAQLEADAAHAHREHAVAQAVVSEVRTANAMLSESLKDALRASGPEAATQQSAPANLIGHIESELRQIAADKDSLESASANQIRLLEAKALALEEQVLGLRAERDAALADSAAVAEAAAERDAALASLASAEAEMASAAAAAAEADARAARLEAAAARAVELEVELSEEARRNASLQESSAQATSQRASVEASASANQAALVSSLRDELDLARKTIDVLEGKVRAAERGATKTAELAAENEQLEDRINELGRTLTNLEDENSVLEEQLRAQIKALESARAVQGKMEATLLAENNTLREAADEAEAKARAAAEAKADVDAALAALESECLTLRSAVQDYKDRANSNQEILDAMMADPPGAKELAAALADKDELADKLATLGVDNATLRATAEELERKVATLQRLLRDTEAHGRDTQADLQAALETARGDAAANAKRLANAQHEAQTASDEADALRHALATARKRLNQASARADAAEQEALDAASDARKSAAAAAAASEDCAAAEAKVVAAKARAQRDAAEAVADLEALRERLRSVETDAALHREAAAAAERSAQRRIADLTARLDAATASEDLSGLVTEMEAELAARDREIARLNAALVAAEQASLSAAQHVVEANLAARSPTTPEVASSRRADRLQRELDALSLDYEAACGELASKSKELRRVKEAAAVGDSYDAEANAALRRELTELRRASDDRLARLRDAHDQEVTALEAELDELRTQLRAKNRAAALDASVDAETAAYVADLEATVDILRAENRTQARTARVVQDNGDRDSSARVAELEATVESLRAKLVLQPQQSPQTSDAGTYVAELEATVESLRAELELHPPSLATNESSRVNQLEAVIVELREALAASTDSPQSLAVTEQLRAELREAKVLNAELRDDLDHVRDMLRRAKERQAARGPPLSSETGSESEADPDSPNLSYTAEVSGAERSHRGSKFVALQEELAQTRAELESTRQSLDIAHVNLARVQADSKVEVQALEQALDAAQSRLAAVFDELDAARAAADSAVAQSQHREAESASANAERAAAFVNVREENAELQLMVVRVQVEMERYATEIEKALMAVVETWRVHVAPDALARCLSDSQSRLRAFFREREPMIRLLDSLYSKTGHIHDMLNAVIDVEEL